MNFSINKIFFRKFFILFLFSLSFLLFLSLSAMSYSKTISTSISDKIFRIHIIANSNSTEDQNLKLKVRNAILEYLNSLSLDFKDKSQAISSLKFIKDNIEDIASNVIEKEGFSYPVKISFGSFYFPTKYYEDYRFPPGYYDAIKIELGEARGENWWSVMFPPLSFSNISFAKSNCDSNLILRDTLSKEEFNLIFDKNSKNIIFKFKLLELINSK